MSVRRVSDLPSLAAVAGGSPQNFGKSLVEISYLSSQEDGQRYFSTYTTVDDFIQSFLDRSSVSPNISGDVRANFTDPGGATGNFSCKLGFLGGISARGDVVLSGDISANEISCVRAFTTNGLVQDEYPGGFVLNYQQIKAIVSSEVSAQLRAQQTTMNPVPFLAIVYSDHQVLDNRWAVGGSTVVMSEHPELCAWLCADTNPGIERLETATSCKYRYTIGRDSGNRLSSITLPSCDTYFRCTMESTKLCKPLSSSVPGISGVFGQLPSSSQTMATGAFRKKEKTHLGPNDGTKGNKDWTIDFSARRSSPVYGKYASDPVLSGEVVPETTMVFAYYYVG